MRLVLDTNVLVSAAFWKGPEWRLLQACLHGEHQLIVSPFILDELHHVMVYKFDTPDADVGEYVLHLVRAAVLVDPERELEVIKADPSDDRILEAAVAGHADCLVTGDRHLLELMSYDGVRICRAADL